MGQKVSSISLRLGKRLCWSSIWTAKTNDYGTSHITTLERQHYLQSLTTFLGSRANEFFVLHSNKPTKTFVKLINNSSFGDIFDVSHAKNSQSVWKQKYNIKDVSAISKKNGSTTDVFLHSLVNLRERKLENGNQLNLLPVLNAQLLSDFIAEQVRAPENQKSQAFKQNLLSGVAKITLALLKRVRLSKSSIISGLKIECSGKWKQTASGRKQKLLFTVGSIKAQSMDQFLSFGFSTINTKFGSCSFKVWVCFKPC